VRGQSESEEAGGEAEMILCVCRGVSEREVGETIGRGAASVDEVAHHCGAGLDCGTCRHDIHELLRTSARPSIEVAA
jgi:bacterioferritin-associated ferredoxin